MLKEWLLINQSSQINPNSFCSLIKLTKNGITPFCRAPFYVHHNNSKELLNRVKKDFNSIGPHHCEHKLPKQKVPKSPGITTGHADYSIGSWLQGHEGKDVQDLLKCHRRRLFTLAASRAIQCLQSSSTGMYSYTSTFLKIWSCFLVESVNNEGYYTQEFALMKSDPPIAQRWSPRHQTGRGSGGPRIRSETQPSAPDPVGQPNSRKRKLVLSDDEDDTARKLGDREATKKLPKQATPRKKTSSSPVPKIKKSTRCNSYNDLSCIDAHPL